MATSIRGSNKVIESKLYCNNGNTPISSKILEKHLTENQHPIFNFIEGTFDKMVKFIKPMYSITVDRIVKNITGLIASKWQFQLPQEEIEKNIENQQQFIRMSHYLIPQAQNPRPSSRQSISLKSSMRQSKVQQSDLYKRKYNRSIFLFVWGPLTTIILTHLISNHPFATQQNPNHTMIEQTSDVNVIAGGIIHLLSMTLISFFMFVVFKVLKADQVHSLFQHMNLASFVGLTTIVYSLVCSTSMNFLIIPVGIAYILGCSYLHVNAYNQAIKPQLLELIGMGLIIFFCYVCTGYMFYHYYHESGQVASIQKQKHFVPQVFGDHYLHQRRFMI